MMISLLSVQAGKKEPRLVLLPMQAGRAARPLREGTWESEHPDGFRE